jgi:hypothetical protein
MIILLAQYTIYKKAEAILVTGAELDLQVNTEETE